MADILYSRIVARSVAAICIICCIMCITSPLSAVTRAEILNLEDTYQFNNLRKTWLQMRKDTVTVQLLYCQALFEPDAQEAYQIYRRLYQMDSLGVFADRALWRMAQFHYIEGGYLQARSLLTKLTRRFPTSVYFQEADEQIAMIHEQFGDSQPAGAPGAVSSITEPAQVPRPIIQSQRDRPIADKEEVTIKPVDSLPLRPQPFKGNYTLQTGAFANPNNAERLRDYLQKRGFTTVQIRTKRVHSQLLYVVLVGDFQSENAARRAGELLNRKAPRLSYQLVQIR